MHGHPHPAPPIQRGVWLAGLAALLFGVTTPVTSWASGDASPLTSAALLYAGASLAAGVLGGWRALRNTPWGTLALVALAGAVVAPVLLVSGLRTVDPGTASLLLTLEAPLTMVLARVFHREHVGGRMLAGAISILGGSLLLCWQPQLGAVSMGALLVALAALAWAADNTLSRRLAHLDTLGVVAGKGALGAAFSAVTAGALQQSWPTASHTGALLLVGASGYGISLVLYLRAQALMGAGRTASVFAAAPFIGVLASVAAGLAPLQPILALAALPILLGVWLHATERHAHAHAHPPLEHAHPHTHDDGHHLHAHDPMPSGPHDHPHRHDAQAHEHEHGEDAHHAHVH